jgi:hypothetical protein
LNAFRQHSSDVPGVVGRASVYPSRQTSIPRSDDTVSKSFG